MAGKGTLTVRVVGDAEKFNKTMDGVQGKLGKVAGGIAKVGKIVAVGTAAAGAGAFALGREVLSTGAQLTSWRQKTATVFEGSAADIRKWADKNNEVFGITDDQLAGLAANFGDLLKPMGFTADQAGSMAKEVVGLSGALSEWTGGQTSAAEVSEILSKAMLGEREELKSLGISITEADVQARLAAKGQDKLTGAALQQAKALATQELIFEKSTDAQKAYADGGNKALRASNKLKSGLAELREQVADKLLPVFVGAVSFITDKVGPVLADLAGMAGQVFGVLFRGDFTGGPFDEDSPFIASVFRLRDVMVPIVTGAFDAIRGTVDAVVSFVGDLLGAFRSDHDNAASGVGEAAGRISEILGSLQESFSSAFGAIQAIVETAVKIIVEIWDRFGNTLLDRLKAFVGPIQDTVQGMLAVLTGIFDLIKAVLTGKWGEAWDAIQKILGGAWDAIGGMIRNAFAMIALAFEAFKAAISALWSLIWNSLKTIVSDAVSAIVGFVRELPGRLLAFGGDMLSAGAGLGGKFLDGLKRGLTAAAGFAGDIASGIVNVVKGAWNTVAGMINDFVPNSIGWGPFKLDLPDNPIPRFDNGGVMPGPRGRHGLALVAGGETVLPTHKRAMSGVSEVHVHFHGTVFGDDRAVKKLTEQIRRELLHDQRRNPGLGFT